MCDADMCESGLDDCLPLWHQSLTLTLTGVTLQLIRRWRAGVCAAGLLAEAAPPLFCHHAPVRCLAAGPAHTLVSGDSRGDIAIWRV